MTTRKRVRISIDLTDLAEEYKLREEEYEDLKQLVATVLDKELTAREAGRAGLAQDALNIQEQRLLPTPKKILVKGAKDYILDKVGRELKSIVHGDRVSMGRVAIGPLPRDESEYFVRTSEPEGYQRALQYFDLIIPADIKRHLLIVWEHKQDVRPVLKDLRELLDLYAEMFKPEAPMR